jgi:general secretion pathway protein D
MKTNNSSRRGIVLGLVVAALVGFPPALAQEEDLPPIDAGMEIVGTEPLGEGLRMNFQGVPLDTVLDYLSRQAGFTIVREVQVEGRVNVVSHQPLDRDEVVELLNSVLNGMGYAALRSGRTLTIVRREDAIQRNIPVKMGSEPGEIPATDEMVTQIIPVRYADAAKLVANLQPLLAPYAVLNPNESSNAIVLTDTQANVRRMVEIINALDTSIAGISGVRVFPLTSADAQETADLVTKVFQSADGQGPGRGMPMFQGRGGPPFGGMFGGGQGDGQAPGDSEARRAQSTVVAVAETRTNAVVVSAPDDLLPTITNLIEELDTISDADTEVRVFPLENAKAEDMATLITSVFNGESDATRAQGGTRFAGPGEFFRRMAAGGGPGGPGMPFGPGMPGMPGGSAASAGTGTVTASADERTNAVIVNAPAQLMTQIEAMLYELDQSTARTKKVYVYSLKNADAETVAAIVEGMFRQGGGQSSIGGQRQGTGQTGVINRRNTGNTGNTGGAGGFGGAGMFGGGQSPFN